MKQKLLIFSALLIVSLLMGTAGAIEDAENTDVVSVGEADLSVKLSYSGAGYFKDGDIVKITATFNKPVSFVYLTGEAGDIPLFDDPMDEVSDTVWCLNYTVEGGINDAVDVTVSAFDSNESKEPFFEKTDAHAFVIDNEAPKFKRIQPSSEYVNAKRVVFEFIAFDKLSKNVAYTIYINDTQIKTGNVASNGIVKHEVDKSDGYYKWEVKLNDYAGNEYKTGPIDLYVDTKDPYITLISPEDFFVCTDEYPLAFNFTCQDTLSETYNMKLYYQLYIDGEPFDELNCSGYMTPGEYVNIEDVFLLDGAHNWSVYVEDNAGNICTGKVRNFFVNCDGLEVELLSPDGGFVPANPEFKFEVSGGAGLPFGYELLINKDPKNESFYIADKGSFIVGEDHHSVSVKVDDGEDMLWTVRIKDCAGETYEPEPLSFSVDTKPPAAVANLFVMDALSETTWCYIYDEPGLYVSWDKNTDEDLHDGEGLPYGLPYVVFISDFKPCCIEDMELAVPVSCIYDSDMPECCPEEHDGELFGCNEPLEPAGKMFMHIGEYGGKPLVYGKDYWVAVIALDRAGNYNKKFVISGPVQTYEDMTITLDAGWNLKSVPKSLAKFNKDPCSVFGECNTVIYWNGICWEFPEVIEPCKAYWVYTPEACMTNVKFKPMALDSTVPDVPPSLDLVPGWQMIGHTSTVPVHWSRTLGSMKGFLVDYQFSNIITYSHHEGWGGTISLGFMDFLDLVSEDESIDETPYPVGVLKEGGFMVPGQGYWIFMKECGTYASVESVTFYEDITPV